VLLGTLKSAIKMVNLQKVCQSQNTSRAQKKRTVIIHDGENKYKLFNCNIISLLRNLEPYADISRNTVPTLI